MEIRQIEKKCCEVLEKYGLMISVNEKGNIIWRSSKTNMLFKDKKNKNKRVIVKKVITEEDIFG